MLRHRSCARLSDTEPLGRTRRLGQGGGLPVIPGSEGLEHLPWREKMASVQGAGWSKIQRPKGVASSGLAFQDTQSDRWGQPQGILGHRPTQKSGRAGTGILRSVPEGEVPPQRAALESSVQPGREAWQWLRRGGEKRFPVGMWLEATAGPEEDQEQSRELGYVPTLEGQICMKKRCWEEGPFRTKVSSCFCESRPRGVSQTEATLSLSLWDDCPGNQRGPGPR